MSSEAKDGRGEERYQILFEQSADAFLIIRGESFIDCNQAAVEMLGYRNKSELLNTHPSELSPEYQPDGRRSDEKASEMMRRAYAGSSLRFEWMHQRANGEVFPVDVLLTAVTDSEGGQFLHTTWRDMTNQKRTEMALGRLSTVIEQLPEAIVLTDVDGVIEYVNPAFESLTGYARHEAVGRTPRILKSSQHGAAFYSQLWKTMLAGDSWEGRLVNKRKDGSIYTAEASISPVRDQEGTVSGYASISRDISQELVMEEQLRQNQKMDSIGQLAGGVAHDLNNLLTPILGYSQILMDDLSPSDLNWQSAKEIHQAGVRARDLVRQLLAFSRKQELTFRAVDLNRVLNDFKGLLQRSIRSDIGLVFDLADALPPIMADTGQVDQIVMNLAVNAQDAMPEGGKITIETSVVELAEERLLEYGARVPGTYVQMRVTDEGAGIDEGTMARIFEPFFTTKEMGEGTGLGLSTVFGIVNQHKGVIRVDSRLGEGTVFTVLFPVTAPDQQVEDVLSAADVVRREVTGTVVLVEDDELVRALAVKTLERCGLLVHAFDGAAALLGYLTSECIRPDLLVTDVVMPTVNGLELAKEVRHRYEACKVLYISGYVDDILSPEDLSMPGVALLNKPFGIQEMRSAVCALLEG